MFRQAWTSGIDDNTTRVATQTPLDDGHCYPVEEGHIGKLLVHPEQGMVNGAKELGYSVLVDEFLHAQGQFLAVANLARLVQHTHNKLLVGGSSHHGAIHVLLALLQFSQPGVTLIIKLSHPGEDLLDGWHFLFSHNYCF